MPDLIVWHRNPVIVDRAEADPFDVALLHRLGAPTDAVIWVERDRADEPWTFSVDSIGVVDPSQAGSRPDDPTVMRAIELAERTGAGLLWIRRIVEADGRVLVEDRWSRAELRYLRLLDPDHRNAKRLARHLFDGRQWGPGAPRGREKALDEILGVVLNYRRENGHDPTEEQAAALVGYKDVRSFQRALEASWLEVLGFASQIEETDRTHPDATVIHGFVSVARAKAVKLSPNSVLRKR